MAGFTIYYDDNILKRGLGKTKLLTRSGTQWILQNEMEVLLFCFMIVYLLFFYFQ